MDYADKVSKMQEFVKKQTVTGKIFDFEDDKYAKKVRITKYYDIPLRKIVIIPDFVDELGTSEEVSEGDESIEAGIFYQCQYVEKVVMGQNIHDSIARLFEEFKGKKLDLTDFDTINITDMSSLFEYCKAKDIQFGDKFKTNNVVHMDGMFSCCEIREINLGEWFNTKGITSTEDMFGGCKANKIILGNNFYTSNVQTMFSMFSYCNAKEIDLGDHFDTSKVRSMGCMFESCNIDKLVLNEKFSTRAVETMNYMFGEAKINELYLGSKFKISDVKNQIFVESHIKKLYIHHSTFNITKHGKGLIESTFENAKINNIIISSNAPSNVIEALKSLRKTKTIIE